MKIRTDTSNLCNLYHMTIIYKWRTVEDRDSHALSSTFLHSSASVQIQILHVIIIYYYTFITSSINSSSTLSFNYSYKPKYRQNPCCGRKHSIRAVMSFLSLSVACTQVLRCQEKMM